MRSAIVPILLVLGAFGVVATKYQGDQASSAFLQALPGIGWLIGLALLYLVPTVVANVRKHHHTDPICALNLLLGWTFLGWAIALIWALMPVQPRVVKSSSYEASR